MLISQNLITRELSKHNPGWKVSPAELDSGFVRVGFETEGYAPIPETTGPLVVGRVEHIEELTGFKKPIRYCQVNVGQANGTGELQGIICGARNFAEGDLVAVSLPGAELPGGFKIAARKTYDHISNGMICSATELGLTDKSTDGIIILDEGTPGEDARAILGLDDVIFDVNVTPDRGYALSVRGLTRELASAFDLRFEDPAARAPQQASEQASVSTADLIKVTVEEATKARRFGLRKVSGINPAATSPFWLQRELMAFGARPVNAATDVTNYVMFLLGQPMHAFDAGVISGDLHVRQAELGEKLTTLDHVERELHPEDVVICDANGIQSLAGVMGGATSEIGDSTTDVYFEAATWDTLTVARTSRRHKLSSESSRRFERGVDPALVEPALDLACDLLVSIAGGVAEPGRTLVGEIPAMPQIRMAQRRPAQVAGVEYSTETVVNRLREVGCEVTEEGEDLLVTPPTWRGDITMDADLVEEVLRLEGLEDIPSILPTPKGGRGLTAAQRRRRSIGHALAYHGYAEILPSPFISAEVFEQWNLEADDPRRNTVSVRNPLEADHAVLATTLLPAMLEAVGRNAARGRTDLSLFGVQQVAFKRGERTPMPSVDSRPSAEQVREVVDSLPEQPLHVATVGGGNIEYAGPWGEGRAYTYADAIESARIVARAAGLELEVHQAQQQPWHPGRCAALAIDGHVVGHAGELHPQVLEAMNLPPRLCAMELDITALPFKEHAPAPVLSAFPALYQDIALVVEEKVAVEEVRRALVEGGGDLLESVQLFDVYRADSVGEGKKSLTFSLLFRAGDRTLTDAEANEARLAAAKRAEELWGAQLRG
ncbi:phenylalanine--tRNA ligase subunit beta [Corynebacterium lowii]|uniref:Phenylalanine--tRNA ligase beta subunit n=1 Tax=Corynebacterium lowii TaxID=1544413 RepID=A0A0Q0Z9U2_9CORY|nr:phenylalanine--tRNA ligase subunit beta [Corynebacterium lowii]KQB86469.1 Phenylalanine--tRNA ligase beta subunit [Corynebacterium lowii]MDP9850953.1 phenylalanyl-tRNA synthetase beta chain [Corynebacterium lowii]